jgi:hypothetical protein
MQKVIESIGMTFAAWLVLATVLCYFVFRVRSINRKLDEASDELELEQYRRAIEEKANGIVKADEARRTPDAHDNPNIVSGDQLPPWLRRD